jgi:hypothetical protein
MYSTRIVSGAKQEDKPYLCEILDLHSGAAEDSSLQGCYTILHCVALGNGSCAIFRNVDMYWPNDTV